MNSFQNLNEQNIVIYGLGTETERLLKEWKNKYHILGLLDGFKTSGEQFGYPILDINEVVKLDNVVIIVVARPGSCKAITKRIGELCRREEVPLFDIRGKDLLQKAKVVFDFTSIDRYTKDELKVKVKEVESVSFDLFDTLVVRDIFTFEGILELVDSRLREKGIRIPNFVELRLEAEKALSFERAPRLEEIYEKVIEILPKDEKLSAEMLADFEFAIDCDLLRPREEMVLLIKDFKSAGKRIYLTSDSYYSKEQIQIILKNNGIDGIDEILVSCEYDTGKTGSLFNKLIEVVGTDSILHIGDDAVADIAYAHRHGLKTFRIYSSAEIMDAIGGLNLNDYNYALSEKIKIGMFIANIFNSPFQFEENDKCINVNDAKDVGYLFCAPLILDFTRWFANEVSASKIRNIWFCARDGYLLKKIYDLVQPNRDTIYFYASRISAIRAGVENNRDLEYIDSMKYSGKCEDNLKIRFAIEADQIKNTLIDKKKSGLFQYANVIFEESRKKRSNNQRYIEKLELQNGSIAFFDFVAKGTVQMYIQRLVSNPMKGLYFLQLEPDFMKENNLDIKPFYTEEERDNSVIFDNYYILEAILTSPEPSVDEFDEEGRPIFASESRKMEDISCLKRVQDGIIGYAERYLNICPNKELGIDKKLDETILALIHNVKITDNDFLNLMIEDPFFNRMTVMTDII